MKQSDASKCCVLVPIGTTIEPACENQLRNLEDAGYTVRRLWGCSPVDVARNTMATESLRSEFEETMWIDSDIEFSATDVDKIRAHGLPICAGIYAKKGARALACHLMPSTDEVRFGIGGGLLELQYAGAGFLHVRSEVYDAMVRIYSMTECNLGFGESFYPFFQPMVVESPFGPWYLAEDFAFCHRAAVCGFRVFADTTIRLGHIGRYSYQWEDAGGILSRSSDYTFVVNRQ